MLWNECLKYGVTFNVQATLHLRLNALSSIDKCRYFMRIFSPEITKVSDSKKPPKRTTAEIVHVHPTPMEWICFKTEAVPTAPAKNRIM